MNIPIPLVGLALVFIAGEHILQIDCDLFPKFMRKSRQIDGDLFPNFMRKSRHFWIHLKFPFPFCLGGVSPSPVNVFVFSLPESMGEGGELYVKSLCFT